MKTQRIENAAELVREVVALNCDGERIRALPRAQIDRALRGSGLSDAEIDRVLAELTERGELVRTDEGYRPVAE